MFTHFLSKTTTENQGSAQFLLLVVDWLRPARLEIYSCLAIILSDLKTERFEFCKSEAFVSLGLFSFVLASLGLSCVERSFILVRCFIPSSIDIDSSSVPLFAVWSVVFSFVCAFVPSFFRVLVLVDLFILEVPLLNIFLLSQVHCLLEFMGCGIRTYLQ